MEIIPVTPSFSGILDRERLLFSFLNVLVDCSVTDRILKSFMALFTRRLLKGLEVVKLFSCSTQLSIKF